MERIRMDATTLLARIKGVFDAVPQEDSRASIGPQAFLIALVFAFGQNDHTHSLDAIRQAVRAQTGKRLARRTFWGQLAAKRLFKLLETVVGQLMSSLAAVTTGPLGGFAKRLGVKDILGLDSSSTTLPGDAADDFPGPRRNLAPAAFKWHMGMSFISWLVIWWRMTAAKVHDRKGFPPLKLLRGSLIVLDLGYWDFQLLSDLAKAGAFYLSRVKSNSLIHIAEVVSGLNKKKYVGRNLLRCRKAKKKRKIIAVTSAFADIEDPIFTARVVEFWNKSARCYHWYVTNPPCAAKLLYPFYRLRWQIELAFKSTKTRF